MGQLILSGNCTGAPLVCDEGLSFWGGVDAETGCIVDAHHPQCGAQLAGRVLLMPTSRGSCSGSGVLLGLALSGLAPAALVFSDAEDVMTLGAIIASRMFDKAIAVLRLTPSEYDAVAASEVVSIQDCIVRTSTGEITLDALDSKRLQLTAEDRSILEGGDVAAALAMEILCIMALSQGAQSFTKISRVHIDACIYASPAFLSFARAMADMGAQVKVPVTMNAISVDYDNWRAQGVPEPFGNAASRLAEAYVEMGAQPSFTCAPYLLEDKPSYGEDIAWAESNAVIYANSVLGARTVKHPDFVDLCAALTGRAPRAGVYVEEGRRPDLVVRLSGIHKNVDDAFWPMLGWLVGKVSPNRIPLIDLGDFLKLNSPSEDDLKAVCAAFGTTSSAPMLHIKHVTPEWELPLAANAETVEITKLDFRNLWHEFNSATEEVNLVALGSPHFSVSECEHLARLIEGKQVKENLHLIVTVGRATLQGIRNSGVEHVLVESGVTVISDLCWCSISEPVFPPDAKVLMTNSGKYAHYAPGLSGRAVRFGSLANCVQVATTGGVSDSLPEWLNG